MITRRDFNRLVVLGSAAAALTSTTAASGGGPVRMPLHEFVSDPGRLDDLRRGVAEMRKRDPSDPLSWFYQAAIHGVEDKHWAAQAEQDPKVLKVDRDRYWNQCPHFDKNSANFLPWHRAYTYHFEQILRLHVGQSDFALPYWDYSIESQRTFPREFGTQHLNGNFEDDSEANLNPLFHAERDFFLCGYEHPFTDQLPLTELSKRAVDTSRVMNSPIFFGATESDGIGGGIADSDRGTRGLMEQSPHDQIHRAVGGNVTGTDGAGNPTFALGGMAIPKTAGFDPIFCVHHANMDRLWATWSRMRGKTWGTLPPRSWFDEKPWYFFDSNGNEVNLPRRDYFDYRALGISFQDDDLTQTPIALPEHVSEPAMVMAADAAPRWSRSLQLAAPTEIPLGEPTTIPLTTGNSDAKPFIEEFGIAPTNQAMRSILTLEDVDLSGLGAFGFDVYLVTDDVTDLDVTHPGYLGTISLFNHAGDEAFDQQFDVSGLLATTSPADLDRLSLRLVPFALTTPRTEVKSPAAAREAPMKTNGVTLLFSPEMPSTSSHGHN